MRFLPHVRFPYLFMFLRRSGNNGCKRDLIRGTERKRALIEDYLLYEYDENAMTSQKRPDILFVGN